MNILYIGIDNGVTGAIVISDGSKIIEYSKMPVYTERNYTKKKSNIQRINALALSSLIASAVDNYDKPVYVVIAIERPMINNVRFRASISAARALEATLNAIEYASVHAGFDYEIHYVDARQWGKYFGFKNIKKDALRYVKKNTEIKKKDLTQDIADAIMITFYAINNLSNFRTIEETST